MQISKKITSIATIALAVSLLQGLVLSPSAHAVETQYKLGAPNPIDGGVFDDFGNLYLVGAGSPGSADVGLGNIPNYSWGSGGVSIVKIPGAVDGDGNPTGAGGARELLYREEELNRIWNAGTNSWTVCASTHGQTGTGEYGCKGDKAAVGISDHNTYSNWINFAASVAWSDTHTLLIGDNNQAKVYKFDISTGIFWTFIDNTIPGPQYGQAYRSGQYINDGAPNTPFIATGDDGVLYTMTTGTSSDGGGKLYRYDESNPKKLTLVWQMRGNGAPTTDRNGGGAAATNWCGRAESFTLDPAGYIYVGCNNQDNWVTSGTFDSVLKVSPVTAGGVTTYTDALHAYLTSHGSWVRITSDAKGQIFVGSPNGQATALIAVDRSVSSSPLNSTANWVTFDRAGNLVYFNGSGLIKVTGQGYAYPPRGMVAEGRVRSAYVSWRSPGVTGIETYTVISNPVDISQDPSGTKLCQSVKPAGSLVPNFNCTVNNLLQGVQYSITMLATTVKGDSLQTTAYLVTPFDVPGAPTIGTATAYDSHTATVTYTAPANDGGSPILKYVATAYPSGETGTALGAGNGTISVTRLPTNTPETFTVVAINAYGTSLASLASNSVTPLITTTPPVAAISLPVPDQAQSAKVISYQPHQGPLVGGNTVLIAMSISGCPVRNISLDGYMLPSQSWSVQGETLSVMMPAHRAGVASLLLYNGCVPLLNQLTYSYLEPVIDTPQPAVVAPAIKAPEPIKEINVQPTKVMRKIGTIYFASGTYQLDKKSLRTLTALAEKITADQPSIVLSYGHTDNRGGVDNTLLSRNRAKAAAKILRSLLTGPKIATGWFAATKPIATGTTAADLAKNRRVEIYIK
jgi:outer membrane protein OmpA-like peptidoglycan-associated protein